MSPAVCISRKKFGLENRMKMKPLSASNTGNG
jgi:hypothetical protein